MKLIYGTGNAAKIRYMQQIVQGLGITIEGLEPVIHQKIENQIEESGSNPLENAKIKALAYYERLKQPVFSCDSALYLEGVQADQQPGVHIRRVGGKTLTDDEMIEHYSKLAESYGGTLVARYRNAIALIIDEDRGFYYDGEDIASVPFYLTAQVNPERNPGFPLDSISKPIGSDYDFATDTENKMSEALQNFFVKAMKNFACTRGNGRE